MDKKEIFINKAAKKYGNIYDFSSIEYVDAKHFIYPYCKKHKKYFKTTADHFLNANQICDECRLEKQQENLKKEFIEKSMKVHNGEFSYDHVDYKNERTEVLVTCKKHGDFLVKPCVHKYYNGKRGKCPICESEKKYKEYVNYCLANHKIKYNYDKLNLDAPREDGKVCIICPKHGEFWQNPYSHKGGDECPLCNNESKRMTTSEFIELASKRHQNKYVYHRTDLNNKNENGKIIVTCLVHGDFLVTPNNHLRGKGCPKCAGRNKTTETIIEEFKKIHGDDYDYSSVIYKGAKAKIKIKCKKCGEYFSQTPNKHLSGEGCPYCKSSALEKETKNFLEEKGVEYIKEHKDKWLGLQRLDFYLPQYNVAIECQGKQHFAKFYNTEEGFEKIKCNDLKKYTLCKQNGIKIFYYAKNDKRYIPDTYYDKIYFNLDELFKEIIDKTP